MIVFRIDTKETRICTFYACVMISRCVLLRSLCILIWGWWRAVKFSQLNQIGVNYVARCFICHMVGGIAHLTSRITFHLFCFLSLCITVSQCFRLPFSFETIVFVDTPCYNFSAIFPFRENYGCEVVCFTADVGQVCK
jgi:hypothetical protein